MVVRFIVRPLYLLQRQVRRGAASVVPSICFITTACEESFKDRTKVLVSPLSIFTWYLQAGWECIHPKPQSMDVLDSKRVNQLGYSQASSIMVNDILKNKHYLRRVCLLNQIYVLSPHHHLSKTWLVSGRNKNLLALKSFFKKSTHI